MINHTHLQSYQFEELQFAVWLKSPRGVSFMAQEQGQLASLMPRAFGHYSVYLGLNAALSSTQETPIKNAMALTANPQLGGHTVVDPHQLPLATEAIDLVVLQHVLDMSNNPHQTLREAARVVNAGGRLVITGFNPFSVWGLWRHLRFKRGVPWRANFLALRRLKDWLSLLNFGDFDIKPVYDCAPAQWRSNPWLTCFINPLGSGYVLSAVKQETRVHLVKTHWRNRVMKPSFGLAGATRQPSQNKRSLENS
ncbi:MAG: methyltransferase domain-containing protein [Oceanospirillaceae bacterium]|jgi:SAM-dependent methyltransferase|nr:methyltransferase domain-containing protein [Oceanospirillaceae bacterium]MBT4442309.1 methyltransferase domain-containing protein [Oceanospirillaceae bacterium]